MILRRLLLILALLYALTSCSRCHTAWVMKDGARCYTETAHFYEGALLYMEYSRCTDGSDRIGPRDVRRVEECK